jgi:hypothetical protein
MIAWYWPALSPSPLVELDDRVHSLRRVGVELAFGIAAMISLTVILLSPCRQIVCEISNTPSLPDPSRARHY